MPSELERIARDLLATVDEVPRYVTLLRQTAQDCRENAQRVAQLAGGGDPRGRDLALRLDDAARRCEDAAEVCVQVPPAGHRWAEEKVGSAGTTGDAATTQLVRTEGSLRYEKGQPTDDSDRAGELTRTDDSDKTTRRERRQREWTSSVGEAGENVQNAINKLHSSTLPPPPGPTGSHVGATPAPRYQAPPREGWAGDAALTLAVLVLVLTRGVQKVLEFVQARIGRPKAKE